MKFYTGIVSEVRNDKRSIAAYHGCTEVTELHDAAVVDENIPSLDVAMDYSLRVEILEPSQDLLRAVGYPLVREGTKVHQQCRH